MIIFNGLAIIQGLFALLPAILVGSFFSCLGVDPAVPGAIVVPRQLRRPRRIHAPLRRSARIR